jgi:hypothetical protein
MRRAKRTEIIWSIIFMGAERRKGRCVSGFGGEER